MLGAFASGCRPEIYGTDVNSTTIVATSNGSDIEADSPSKIPEVSYHDGEIRTVTVNSTVLLTPTQLTDHDSEITSCAVQSGTTALPGWAEIDPNTCEISGTPTSTAETATYKIVATNSYGDSQAATLRLKVADTFVDSSGNIYGFGGGTHLGTVWSTAKSALVLGAGGGCTGSSTNCSELDASWTPKYSEIAGYWKFNGTGTTAIGDLIPATIGVDGISAVNSNAFTSSYVSSGKINQALSVGDFTNCVRFPRSSTFEQTNFTVAFWISPKTDAVDMVWSSPALFSKWEIAGGINKGYAFTLDYNSGELSFNVGYGSGTGTAVSSVNLKFKASAWYHVAGTIDSVNSKMKLYVNGALVGEANLLGSVVHTTTDAYFGCIEPGLHLAPVKVDELAIWSDVLSADEIHTIYARQNPKGSGTFTSRVFDAFDPLNWQGISWLTTLPLGKELPDNGASEITADYSAVSSNLMSGNVGLWHFNETDQNSALGGGDFKDSSGNSNHASIAEVGNIKLGAPGKLSGALQFSGAERVEVANSPTLENVTDTNYTFSAWIKPRGTGAQFVMGKPGYDSGIYYHADQKFRFAQWFSEDGGIAVGAMSSSAYAHGVWVHVVGVVSYTSGGGGSVKLYINGDGEKITQPISSSYSTPWDYAVSPIYIGGGFTVMGSVSTPFFGDIDEVAIWNRALSAAEVLQLYRRGSARIGLQARACALANCADNPEWIGPDGTKNGHFTELQNNSLLTALGSPIGSVKLTSPGFLWEAFSSVFLDTRRYFQYRVVLESDGPKTPLFSPELKSVTIVP